MYFHLIDFTFWQENQWLRNMYTTRQTNYPTCVVWKVPDRSDDDYKLNRGTWWMREVMRVNVGSEFCTVENMSLKFDVQAWPTTNATLKPQILYSYLGREADLEHSEGFTSRKISWINEKLTKTKIQQNVHVFTIQYNSALSLSSYHKRLLTASHFKRDRTYCAKLRWNHFSTWFHLTLPVIPIFVLTQPFLLLVFFMVKTAFSFVQLIFQFYESNLLFSNIPASLPRWSEV